MEGSTTIPQGSRPEAGPKRETERTCTQCSITKPIDEFDRFQKRKHIRQQCNTCVRLRRRWWILATKYGLSREQFTDMMQKQNGVCAICRCEMTTVRFKQPSVDHSHKTGKVRGLLCHGCNVGIGMLKESPIRLRAAIEYLERHGHSDDIVSSSG